MYLRLLDTLRHGADVLGPCTPAGRRVDETRRFFDFIRVEMPAMLARWRDKQR